MAFHVRLACQDVDLQLLRGETGVEECESADADRACQMLHWIVSDEHDGDRRCWRFRHIAERSGSSPAAQLRWLFPQHLGTESHRSSA